MVLWCIESLQEHVFFSFFDIAGFQVLRAYLLIQFDIFCNCCCAHIVGTTVINAGASKKCNQFLSAVQHWKVALLLRSFPSAVTFHFTSVLQLLFVWVFKLTKKTRFQVTPNQHHWLAWICLDCEISHKGFWDTLFYDLYPKKGLLCQS